MMRHYALKDAKPFPWRGDETTMITPCVTDQISSTLGCGYLKLTRTAVRSTIDFDEVIVVLGGHFRSQSADGTFDCAPGDTLWIPAGSSFTLETDSEAILFWAKYPAKTRTPPST
jgi:ethanolamine utilization protein EutQ (cupin superfamily)